MRAVKRNKTAIILATIAGVAVLAAMMNESRGAWHVVVAAPWICVAFMLYVKLPISAHHGHTPIVAPATSDRRLAEVYRATAEALASAIAAKDTYEQHHVSRVQSVCELVAAELGLDRHTIEGIGVAALVHDVGKLGVPDNILLKPGPLDPEEFVRISNHASVGAKILEHVDYPWNVREMVLHHHERFDGTGYPERLAGDQIPLGARIIAVAEVYDALVSDRCYKSGWTHRAAVEHIEKLSRTHFDPIVVNAFLAVREKVAGLDETIVPDPLNDADQAASEENPAAAHIIAQANRELMSLLEIAETLSSTLELDEVLALLAHRTRWLSEAATCVVFLRDESDPRELVASVAVGRYQELIAGAHVKVGRGVTGKAASKLKPYMGHYDPNDFQLNMHGQLAIELKSCLIAPIVSFGELIGTINLYDDSTRAFATGDLQTLVAVASRAALAIQNATAFESVRDSAMKDPVTGLYNGRYLRNYLDHEISRATRRDEPLSVLGIDLDNFKLVNDTFGHGKGDTVLRDAAEIFQRQLRDYDLVVRNGGDEFIVVLPGTPASEAKHTAQRIQREIATYAKRAMPDADVGLGVSIGVASYPANASDVETLLARADAEMYRDKRARKQNRLAA